MQSRDIVSALLLPLQIEGQVVGGLVLGATEPRHRLEDSWQSFSGEEVALAQRVMEQVSGALARTRLTETQRRLSTIVEQAAEAVIITDTEGVITYVNPAFESILGYSQAEVHRPEAERVARGRYEGPCSRPDVACRHRRAGLKDRIESQASDGSPLTLDQTVDVVRNQTGEAISYVATLRDVTREVQLEKQFHQAQKMEALGRLAGGIAHEF